MLVAFSPGPSSSLLWLSVTTWKINQSDFFALGNSNPNEFTCLQGQRYVSIKPDNEKLANGTDVLNLLIDTLLMEGFHLVTPRTVSSEEKTECYGFERKKRPEALVLNKSETRVSVMPEQSQKKK
ncbi:E3 ubiquitin-protein ligase TRIM13 isoform X2 [Phyllostomus discolor]|uniref:E3 ubiquitin-protein ligase TRIM13 isoform X2 n=1 Tax=Phyllostomus discolor TaxID=89673 RepID=A0A7E6CK54_9CHIR|nr:E3 ubiquitin-protein ligase TRIM13 isoform X2 [Phyllostomus discolor]